MVRAYAAIGRRRHGPLCCPEPTEKKGRPRRTGITDAFIESTREIRKRRPIASGKDRAVSLLAFRNDFPAEHWKHLRTTNPIESTFSTVRPPHASD